MKWVFLDGLIKDRPRAIWVELGLVVGSGEASAAMGYGRAPYQNLRIAKGKR